LKQKTCEEDKKDNTAKSVEGLNSNLKLPKVIDIDRWIMTEELTLEEVGWQIFYISFYEFIM